MHPLGAGRRCAVAACSSSSSSWTQNKVAHRRCAGCQPLHRAVRRLGAAGLRHLWATALWRGGVSFLAQLLGTVLRPTCDCGRFGGVRAEAGYRPALEPKEEFEGADLAIPQIGASPGERGWLVASGASTYPRGPTEGPLVSFQESRSCSPASCGASPRSIHRGPRGACTLAAPLPGL